MSVVRYIGDRLMNAVANLGTPRDKASSSVYVPATMTYQELLNAYRGAWLPRKIVDIPALDATRKWRNWQGSADEITALEAEETRLQYREKVRKAKTAARLFGGSALYIGTGDANQSLPLDLGRIGRGGLRYLTPLAMRHLTAGEIERDPVAEGFGRPRDYTLTTSGRETVTIHPSRLALFYGAEIPGDGEWLGEGWGDSSLIAVMDAVRHADSTSANVASLVFEAKIDVISIPGLSEMLSDARGESALATRLTAAASMKGINGTVVIDGEESYEQKSASFGTLPEVMDRFYQAVAGAADIPMTRLFGMSPAGLNATGDGDLKNYYDRIQAMQQLELQPAMATLDEALIRSALGTRPPELHYVWASLWQTSEKERADIGKITAETVKVLKESGLFPGEVLSKAGSNALIEGGALPGLEAAIEEFGLEVPEDDPNDLEAAMLPEGET